MADNPTGPADPNAPKPATSPAPTGGTPQVDLSSLLAENKRLADERATLAKQYGDLRKFSTQKSQEAAEYRRRLEAAASASPEYDFGDPNPPARPTGSTIDPERLQNIEANQAIINFKLDHSDWNEAVEKDKDGRPAKSMWQAINELLDESNPISQTLAGATPYLTLKNAYREVRLQQLQKANTEAAAAKAAADANRNLFRARAGMSGQPASGDAGAFDLNDPNLTADQFLDAADKAGMLEGLVDPNDPPSFLRK